MSGEIAPLRVITARSVAQLARLPKIYEPATSSELRPVKWRANARTDDGLTIIFMVNISEEMVVKIVGVQVVETDDYVALNVFGQAASSDAPRALLSAYAEFCVDLERPIGNRKLRSNQ